MHSNRILGLVLLSILSLLNVLPANAAESTSTSTSVLPYVVSHLPGVEVESILTVDDGNVAKAGGGTTQLVGIPDGIGVVDGSELTPAENDYFYLLVNHEISDVQGVARDHGNAGSFVSKWKIDKTSHEVVEGDDLIKETFSWDENTSSFVSNSITFNRLCSADRPAATALHNSTSGFGSSEILFMNGEETSGGRAFAHVVTGSDAGKSFHLPHFGYAAFENVLLNPTEQDATVAIMTDDASNGEVYLYVGTKQNTGNEVEKAGLVGGKLYALAVVGKPYELDQDLSTAIGQVEIFTFKLLGEPGNYPADGSETAARGTDTTSPVDPTQNFESLKMGGPEDGAWDTRSGFEDTFYFATKGTSSNGINAPTRVWKLEFDDIADPAAGGTMTMLLDGPENRLGSLDNMAFEVIDGEAKLYLQEDLGGDARLSKIWEYDIADGSLTEIATHDAERFRNGGSDYITENEESSGIVSLKNVLGEGWFAASVQVHSSNGLSDSTEQVEHGQLVLIDISSRGEDMQRERIIASGDLWDYRVDGVDPGADWNQVGFTPDANWNVDTDGTSTGPAATMLGYGESSGRLVSDLVQPATPRAASYYFRHEFDLTAPAEVNLFDLFMKVDDGAVVYINGVEVARYNMSHDLVVGNDTYASDNEPSERDWKRIPIASDDPSLQTTGNVIAVSMHQENSGSSDLRMDMELIAWRSSPDAGNAPVTPANVAVVNPAETSLELTWDAQTDAKFFRIERQADSDVAWKVIESEFPGSFSGYVDSDVNSGVTYEYRLVAHNIYGRSASSTPVSGTTLVSLVPVIFEEDFEAPESTGQFTSVDVAASDRNWSWVTWEQGSTGAVQGNNYGGSAATEDWLITTNPINFLFNYEEELLYDEQASFGGPVPEVLVSTDYDPAVDTDPNAATWTVVNNVTADTSSLEQVGPFDLSGVDGNGYLAFKYTGDGGSGGQSYRYTIDNVVVRGACGYDFVGAEGSDIEADSSSPWIVVNNSSDLGWLYETRGGQLSAINNNYNAAAGGVNNSTEADDWLISPEFSSQGPLTGIDFEYYENYGDTLEKPLAVYVTDAYTGNPATTTWVDITPPGLNGSTTPNVYEVVSSDTFGLVGNNLRVAFHYQSAGNGGGTTKRIGVENVCIANRGGPLEATYSYTQNGGKISFVPDISGGTPPYSINWTFGDGNNSTDIAPVYSYAAAGQYTAMLTVTDADGSMVMEDQLPAITVTTYEYSAKMGDLRVASFNAYLNRSAEGELVTDLSSGDNEQVKAVAEIIQRVNPDVILLNEIDYDTQGQAVALLKSNYLEVSQNGSDPISFPYVYIAESNTGLQPEDDIPALLDADFDNNGNTDDGGDAFGFGSYYGQYAMVVLSKFPIIDNQVRTFQRFLWKDMPGALLPAKKDETQYFDAAELDIFRLSSKSHWDVPIDVNGKTVHILASHPTPPVFDDGDIDGPSGDEDNDVFDWNGTRNHDEIRLWADYVTPSAGDYIYDDNGSTGGLGDNKRFVVVGDQNADPVDGDSYNDAIRQLTENPNVDNSVIPTSLGGAVDSDDDSDTASWGLRADYVLPSTYGFDVEQGGVFWPQPTDLPYSLVGNDISSDHRLVWMDLALVGEGSDGDDVADDDDNNNGSGSFNGSILLLMMLVALIRRKIK